LLSKKWTGTIGRRLAHAEQTARVRMARDELRHLRELSQTTDALEAQIAELVAQVAPQLLAEPGFGPLTAGKLIGEIAGAQRFATDAKLARAGGIAPIPVSSGNTNRHRLDRGGPGEGAFEGVAAAQVIRGLGGGRVDDRGVELEGVLEDEVRVDQDGVDRGRAEGGEQLGQCRASRAAIDPGQTAGS
jgi:hypothetical protein